MKRLFSVIPVLSIFNQNLSPKDKTWERINRKIEFNSPINFKPNIEFENSIIDVIKSQKYIDVNVICLPKNFGTTTALKHVATKIQSENNKNLKVVYIDGNEIKQEEKGNKKWFYDNFGKPDYGTFTSTFPNDTKTLIILDHMNRDIIDGFLNSSDKADNFYTCLGIEIHRDRKFIVIVTTNDPSYAKDITNCNGGTKLYLFSELDNSGKWFDGLTHSVNFSKVDFEKFIKANDRYEE